MKTSLGVPAAVILSSLLSLPAFADGGTLDGGTLDGGGLNDAGVAASDAGQASSDAGSANDAGSPEVDAGPDTDPDPDPDPDPQPEPTWQCEPAYYDAADGCDCTCGIPDPDCELPNQQLYGCVAGATGCSIDGYCEIPGCGDGVLNPQLEVCDDGNGEAGDGCSPGCVPEAGWSCSADPTNCLEVPAAWGSTIGPYCFDARYGDGEVCDCGCGALDVDCESQTATCDGLPLGCIPEAAVDDDGQVVYELLQQVPDLEDNTRCVGNVCGDTWVAGAENCDDGNSDDGDLCGSDCRVEVPDGWTCNPEYLVDDQCDCGCGALDPACPGMALDPVGSCDFDECRGPTNVDPADHSLCLEPEPDPEPEPQTDGGAGDGDGDTDGGSSTPMMPACTHLEAGGHGVAPGALALFSLLLIARRRRR